MDYLLDGVPDCRRLQLEGRGLELISTSIGRMGRTSTRVVRSGTANNTQSVWRSSVVRTQVSQVGGY